MPFSALRRFAGRAERVPYRALSGQRDPPPSSFKEAHKGRARCSSSTCRETRRRPRNPWGNKRRTAASAGPPVTSEGNNAHFMGWDGCDALVVPGRCGRFPII